MSFEAPFRKLTVGDTSISAADFNRAFDVVRDLSTTSGGGTIGATQPGAIVSLESPLTLIRILGGSNPYSWEEVVPSNPGAASGQGRVWRL